MMHKKWLLVTIVVLVFATGCGKDKDASSSEVTSEPVSSTGASLSSTSDKSISGSAAVSGSNLDGTSMVTTPEGDSAISGVVPAAPQEVVLDGIFASYNLERYTNERASKFELSSDGTFVFHLNLGDGRIGVERGTYVASGGTLVLTVTDREMTDYLGEDLDTYTFTMLDNDHFIYTGDSFGMSRTADKFTRDGFPDLPDESQITEGPDGKSRVRIPPLPEPTSTIIASSGGDTPNSRTRVGAGGTAEVGATEGTANRDRVG